MTAEIPQNLKAWRKLVKLRQEDVADQLGEPRPTYQAWESGRAPFPPEVREKLRDLGYLGPFPEPERPITLADLESIREEIRSQAAWVREELRKENVVLAADLERALKLIAELRDSLSRANR